MNISFRDPDGTVIVKEDRVLRLVRRDAQSNPVEFVRSKLFTDLVADRFLVQTKFLGEVSAHEVARNSFFESDDRVLLFEHEKIFFTSYPYEWTNQMLQAAGKLTLDIAERVLPSGIGLKDATPYNVLFRGPLPVFVDLLSFEQRDPRDQTWRAYAQFLRTFVRPLLVSGRFGLGLSEILMTHRDGLNASEVAQLCSTTQKLRPPFLSLVTLPSLLSRTNQANNSSIYEQRLASSPQKARYILSRQFKSLRKALKRAAPSTNSRSAWSSYAGASYHSPSYSDAKRNFLRRALSEQAAHAVLDVGCNSGDFSEIAANSGARVVAIDRDSVVLDTLWKRAVDQKLDILPLVVDWTRTTPAIGWRNSECSSFLDRARAKFDCVLMFAVLHHILVTERIPLEETLSLAAELTTDRLIIEFIPPSDPKFRQIARGNNHLHEALTQQSFENVAQKYFRIVHSEQLPDSQRRVYVMRRASDN